MGDDATYLHIPSPPIQIQMQILDLSKIRKLIRDILLAGLLMHIRHNDDPSLDRADGCCAGQGLEGCGVQSWCGDGGWDVDVHLCVGHDEGLVREKVGEVVVRWLVVRLEELWEDGWWFGAVFGWMATRWWIVGRAVKARNVARLKMPRLDMLPRTFRNDHNQAYKEIM